MVPQSGIGSCFCFESVEPLCTTQSKHSKLFDVNLIVNPKTAVVVFYITLVPILWQSLPSCCSQGYSLPGEQVGGPGALHLIFCPRDKLWNRSIPFALPYSPFLPGACWNLLRLTERRQHYQPYSVIYRKVIELYLQGLTMKIGRQSVTFRQQRAYGKLGGFGCYVISAVTWWNQPPVKWTLLQQH